MSGKTEHSGEQSYSPYREIDFGDECDLHFFAPSETKAVVCEFIRQAKEAGRPRIRLIHGKGISEKKRQAREILSTHPDVSFFSDDGPNWGATIILLR